MNEYKNKSGAIKDLRDEIKKASEDAKINFEKEWFRNVLFYIGRQWIVYSRRQNRWDDVTLEKWIPRPVTNKVAKGANTLKSLFLDRDPRPIVSPATNTEEDLATAEVGDMALEVADRESETKLARRQAASWFTICGNVFIHNYIRNSADFGTIDITYERCLKCGAVSAPDMIVHNKCPACGNEGEFKEAVDESGNRIGKQIPRTRLGTDAVPPFEMWFNFDVQNFSAVDRLVRSKRVDVDVLKKMYPDLKDDVLDENESANLSENYMESLAYATGSGGYEYGGYGKPSSSRRTKVIDYVYAKPFKGFEDGLMAVIVGEEVVESASLDAYRDLKGRYLIPFNFAKALDVPGRFWGKSRLDDVIPKQIQRNRYESLIELDALRNANNKWLDPGTNMDQPTGQPGQIIKYDYMGDGRKPEHVAGRDPSRVVIDLIERIDKDIEDMLGTQQVLEGKAPAGVDTFSGLRLLTERAMSDHSESIGNWEMLWEEDARQKMELARTHFVEVREKTFRNDLGNWETKQFTKADLQGGTDIKIEPGSTVAKSKSVENAGIIDSVKLGLVDSRDPAVNLKILEKLGQSELASPISLDIKDAMKEWKEFYDSVKENPGNPESWKLRPRYGIDNEAVHYKDSASRAKEDKFFEMPEQAQQMWIEHAEYHRNNMETEMQAQSELPVKPEPAAVMA